VLLLYTHASFGAHDTGDGHPERPQRVAAAVSGAKAAGREISEVAAPAADRAALLRVHEARYVDGIEAFCSSGGGALDADTNAVTESWEAAIRAAGAGTAAAAALEDGRGEEAFLAVRPPGHHATSTRAMGFCLFNNVAVTAASLAAAGARVAIVDWDVHHGNGTQDTFFRDGSVMYASIHEFPFYPGTGWVDELGAGQGLGSTINIPVPAGTAGDVYRSAVTEVVVPALESFGPDWLLVSAGYDAHLADPLADIQLDAADYGAMATELRATVPLGRTIYFLEGGYDLNAVEASVAATLSLAAPEEESGTSPAGAWRALELAADQLRRN
jgi:acetoin utilization deacetylase AcuC-like enzyme